MPYDRMHFSAFSANIIDYSINLSIKPFIGIFCCADWPHSVINNSALNVRVQRVVLGGIEQDDWRFNLEAIEQGLV